uniref:Uncharacterized protein n=1 Tax=Acrobeloides nanus TaxID=290746 RepID=A0A914CDW1_9BILA
MIGKAVGHLTGAYGIASLVDPKVDVHNDAKYYLVLASDPDLELEELGLEDVKNLGQVLGINAKGVTEKEFNKTLAFAKRFPDEFTLESIPELEKKYDCMKWSSFLTEHLQFASGYILEYVLNDFDFKILNYNKARAMIDLCKILNETLQKEPQTVINYFYAKLIRQLKREGFITVSNKANKRFGSDGYL